MYAQVHNWECVGGLLPKLKKAQLFSDSLYGLRSYQKEGLGQNSKILTNYVTHLYTLTLHKNIMFWNEPPKFVPCIRMDALGAFNKVLPIAQLSKGNSLIKLMVILDDSTQGLSITTGCR